MAKWQWHKVWKRMRSVLTGRERQIRPFKIANSFKIFAQSCLISPNLVTLILYRARHRMYGWVRETERILHTHKSRECKCERKEREGEWDSIKYSFWLHLTLSVFPGQIWLSAFVCGLRDEIFPSHALMNSLDKWSTTTLQPVWPEDHLSNIWPITTMKICPIAYFFAKVSSKFCKHYINTQKIA